MVDEIMEEVKHRRGSKAGPDGDELRKQVVDTLHAKTNGMLKKEL